MNNKRKLELAKELAKRKQLQAYKDDFALFSKEQIRIIRRMHPKALFPSSSTKRNPSLMEN